jgi:molybdenum cofactor biosynthesis protein B
MPSPPSKSDAIQPLGAARGEDTFIAPSATEVGHRSVSTEIHRGEAPGQVRCFVLTVSDTRTEADDRGGALIRELLQAAGHTISSSIIVRDELLAITEAVQNALNGIHEPECILVTGGSGIGPRDVTPEALRPLLTKELPGFGEVFRVLSWEEVGPATMLSRAFAGVIGRTLIFALPGSTNAVRLAMEKLIVPELGHFIREIRPERREG